VAAFMAGQLITGNALNYLLSGKSIYQNQPQNRNRIEIDPRWPVGRVAYEAMKAIDPSSVKGIDLATGVNTKTGTPLTWENPPPARPSRSRKAPGPRTSVIRLRRTSQPASRRSWPVTPLR